MTQQDQYKTTYKSKFRLTSRSICICVFVA